MAVPNYGQSSNHIRYGAPFQTNHHRMKNCPRCGKAMRGILDQGVLVDACDRCRTTWFDAGEIQRILGRALTLGGTIPSIQTKPLPCPACPGRVETRRAGEHAPVHIDVCQKCGGILLDHGEADALQRAAIPTERATTRDATPRTLVRPAERVRQLAAAIGLPIDLEHDPEHRPWAVWALVGLNSIVFVCQLRWPLLTKLGAMIPPEFITGRTPWTLLTPAFLHVGVSHLVSNVYMLWLAGDNIEHRLGHRKFLWLYVASAICGNLAMVIADPTGTTPSLGASGAVAGLMGAYAVLFPRAHILVRAGRYTPWIPLPAWFCFLLWAGFQFLGIVLGTPGIGFWAHLGGLACGAILGVLQRLRSPTVARDTDL